MTAANAANEGMIDKRGRRKMVDMGTRVFVQGALVLGLILLIILVGVFDLGGEAAKGFIIAGAGLAVLAFCLYLDWRGGEL